MEIEQRTEELRDSYRYPGFYPSRKVYIARWDEGARVMLLTRREKKQSVMYVGRYIEAGMIGGVVEYETYPAAMREYSLS